MKNTAAKKQYSRTQKDGSYYLIGEYIHRAAYCSSLLRIARDLQKSDPKFKIFKVREVAGRTVLA